MAKAEWGTKLTCQSCGAVFYDMRKAPPTCPKCGTVQEQEKPRARRASAAETARARAPVPKAVVKPVVEPESEDEVLETGDEEEEEEFIEDTGDMGDDEDDMAGVIEIEDGEEKE